MRKILIGLLACAPFLFAQETSRVFTIQDQSAREQEGQQQPARQQRNTDALPGRLEMTDHPFVGDKEREARSNNCREAPPPVAGDRYVQYVGAHENA